MSLNFKELLNMLAREPRLRTPEITRRLAFLAIDVANEHGDGTSIEHAIVATPIGQRDEFCKNLAIWCEQVRASSPKKLVRHENLINWILLIRKRAEKDEKSYYEGCLDKIDPDWRRRREAQKDDAELNEAIRLERANLREERNIMKADLSSLPKTFLKSRVRVFVQGGAPSLGKKR